MNDSPLRRLPSEVGAIRIRRRQAYDLWTPEGGGLLLAAYPAGRTNLQPPAIDLSFDLLTQLRSYLERSVPR